MKNLKDIVRKIIPYTAAASFALTPAIAYAGSRSGCTDEIKIKSPRNHIEPVRLEIYPSYENIDGEIWLTGEPIEVIEPSILKSPPSKERSIDGNFAIALENIPDGPPKVVTRNLKEGNAIRLVPPEGVEVYFTFENRLPYKINRALDDLISTDVEIRRIFSTLKRIHNNNPSIMLDVQKLGGCDPSYKLPLALTVLPQFINVPGPRDTIYVPGETKPKGSRQSVDEKSRGFFPYGFYRIQGFGGLGELTGDSERKNNMMKIVDKDSYSFGGNAEFRNQHLMLAIGVDRYVADGSDVLSSKVSGFVHENESTLTETSLRGKSLFFIPYEAVTFVAAGNIAYQHILTQTEGYPDIDVNQAEGSALAGVKLLGKHKGPWNDYLAVLGGFKGYYWAGEGDSQSDACPQVSLVGFGSAKGFEVLGVLSGNMYSDKGFDYTATARELDASIEGRIDTSNGWGILVGGEYHHGDNRTKSLDTIRKGNTSRSEGRLGITYGFEHLKEAFD